MPYKLNLTNKIVFMVYIGFVGISSALLFCIHGKKYVMVSNHQPQLDILVLYRLFFPFRWVSKAEVYLPFISWNMVLNGYIKLKPGAFILAKNAQVPIQPVVLNNTKIFKETA